MLIRLFAGLLALVAAGVLLARSRRRRPGPDDEIDAGTGNGWSPTRLERSVDRRLQRAGLAGRFSTGRLVRFKKLAGGAGAALGGMAFLQSPGPYSGLFAVLLGAVGFFSVDWLLARKAAEHRRDVERSLPDVLDQLTICVGAGLGLDGALQRVVLSNEHDPLADELGRVLRDIRVGVPRPEALTAMAQRVDLPELRTVVRAVNQSDKAGLPVGRVLRVQSDEVRDRRRLRAEERAMRMPVKLIFPLVLCVLPALFVVLMGPAALRLAANGITG
jgi:tight adherence protein C